ncbi:heme-binding protein [Thalassoglobus sp. JC818]|uniref:GlcG/HbpS family heme-binding protein n=1 Tax=Thalassoglobus sp. JC818 TaxID=3232136 RepID=UPI003457BD4C
MFRTLQVLSPATLFACLLLHSTLLTADDKSAQATSSPMVERQRIGLTLSGAEHIVRHARAKAGEMNLKVNISVVDEGGHLIAFARMDGARPASVYTSMTKATAAATMRTATGPLPPGKEVNTHLSLAVERAGFASGGKLTTLYGGVPIVVDGQVIGAVGVGGATGEQDAEIASAGIQSLMEKLAE